MKHWAVTLFAHPFYVAFPTLPTTNVASLGLSWPRCKQPKPGTSMSGTSNVPHKVLVLVKGNGRVETITGMEFAVQCFQVLDQRFGLDYVHWLKPRFMRSTHSESKAPAFCNIANSKSRANSASSLNISIRVEI